MKLVIQRVTNASVTVENEVVGKMDVFWLISAFKYSMPRILFGVDKIVSISFLEKGDCFIDSRRAWFLASG